MEWKWDGDKARRNREKHRVSFEAASLVFDDPMLISEPDPHPDDDRWWTLGRVHNSILFVVHTLIEEDGRGRIISARKATSSERKRYEDSGA